MNLDELIEYIEKEIKILEEEETITPHEFYENQGQIMAYEDILCKLKPHQEEK